MTKMGKYFSPVVFVVLLAALFLPTSGCVVRQRPTPRIDVTVNVDIPTEGTKAFRDFNNLFNGRIAPLSLSDEITRIELTVKDSANQTVYNTSTTNKFNVSFQFQLTTAGTYKFIVKGYNSSNEEILFGETTGNVSAGASNSFAVSPQFVNGNLEILIDIDQEVAEKYNIASAKLKLKRSHEASWGSEETLTPGNPINLAKSLQPGLWDASLHISFSRKNEYVTPETQEVSLTYSQEVRPAKTSKLRFTVVFQSGMLVIVQQGVELPYVPPVENLVAAANLTQKTLTLNWDYSTQGATFYVYKQIKETHGGQDYYHYELAGTTTNKTFVISNYDQAEHDRINGVAVNVVVGGKQSGLKILSKSAFTVQP